MTEVLECLEDGRPDDPCKGPVGYHFVGDSLQGWPRCDHHADKRQQRYDEGIERESRSPIPPDWFDESFAGERWEDDY